MSFESSRSMGRAATLLIILGIIAAPVLMFSSFFIRFMFTIPILLIIYIPVAALAFVGNILLIVAMSQFANFYKEPAIFRNTLYGFLTGIIGGIVYVILIFWLLAYATTSIGTYPTNTFAPSASFAIGLVVAAWLGAFILALIQSLFYRAAFNAIAEKSGEDNFRTAGQMMLIGGALTIILIGVLLIFVGWIFATIGFFSMKPPRQPTQAYAPFQQPTVAAWAQKVCPNCGATNNGTDIYCKSCGTKL